MEETTYYMVQRHLDNIKQKVDYLLSVDPMEIDQILKSGHDWIASHIATVSDDLDEAHLVISGQADHSDKDQEYVKAFESFIRK
jgi:hypothetical protein